MSERRLPVRRTLAGFGLILTAATACGNSAPAQPTTAPEYSTGTDIRDYLAQAIAAGVVKACTGEVTLRPEGHVRYTPLSHGDPDNQVPGYSGSFGGGLTIALEQPLQLEVNNPRSQSSHVWFAAKDPEHQGTTIFINEDALSNPDALDCLAQATAETQPGDLLVK